MPPRNPRQYIAPPKPGVIPLRPLGLGEVLDGAFQAARRNGKAMFGSALIIQAISALLSAAFLVYISGSGSLDMLDSGDFSSGQIGGLVVSVLGFLALNLVLQTVAQLVMQGVLVIPVSRAVLNRHTTFKTTWQLAKPRLGKLFQLGLLLLAAEVVGFLLLAVVLGLAIAFLHGWGIALSVIVILAVTVAVVWVSAKLLLAPAAVVLEGRNVWQGIARSWTLTNGQWWRTFGTYFVASLIVGVITGVISTPVGFATGLIAGIAVPSPTPSQALAQLLITEGISAVISGLLGALTLAFQSGVMALIYVDLRMRKEGFDVVLMKEAETAGITDAGMPGQYPPQAPPPYPGAF